MDSIGAIMTRHGSDKDTAHSYGEVYDRLFPEHSRARAGALLEVGIERGGSLRAWEEIFPKFWIWGIDIDCTLINTGRITSFHANSTNPDHIAHGFKCGIASPIFDAIIDDGCHWLTEQKQTYENLWPYLREGGVYVVEDIQSVSAMEWFSSQGFVIHDRRTVKGRGDDIIAVLMKPLE